MCDKYITSIENLKETIEKYGVAIIPSVINEEECKNMADGIVQYFEHITKNWETPFKLEDRESWREFYKLMPLHSMLIQHWEVGHIQASWDLRQNPKIVNIFANFWKVKPEELLVSFDGLSFHLPPEETNKGWFRQPWFHTDQSYTRNEFECLQSWVTALDINEGDATLMVLEGSNKYHADCAKHFNITDKTDWYKLNEKEIEFYKLKCDPVRITCKRGDLVLFDSRVIHCGVEAVKGRKEENFRAIIYLCYLPRLNTDVKKKQKAFKELRTTKHHPCKSLLFSKNPRTYGAELPEINSITPPVLTELGKKLAGF